MSSLYNTFHCDFLVFIAGIRVPDTRISITSSVNAIPTCNISMPPDYRLFGLGRQDRVPVHVFVSDTLTQNHDVGDLDNYLLLFDGELTDFGYTSTDVSRSFVLNAEALPGFLKDAQLDLLTTRDDYARSATPSAGLNGTHIKGHTESLMPSSLFMKGLAPPDKSTQSTIKYPTDFLTNIVQFLMNITSDGEAFQDASLMTQFYSEFLGRLNFANRYIQVPYFDDDQASWNAEGGSGFPILKGLQGSTVFATLHKMGQSIPKSASIYDFINFIVSAMEYEWCFIPAPTYASEKMVQTCLKPLFYEALPPSCNVIFQSNVTSLSLREKVDNAPTRVRFKDLNSVMSHLVNDSNAMLRDLAVYSYFPRKESAVEEGTSTTNAHAELLTDEDYGGKYSEAYTGPRVFDTVAPPWMSHIRFADGDDPRSYCDDIMKHMYYLKKYEARKMSIQSSFNPYLVAGFPGVVYDADNTDLKFIGHVLTVQHTIAKNTMSTAIEMGYTRTLQEEIEDPLDHTLPTISEEVTHVTEPMTAIYAALLGSEVTAQDVNGLENGTAFTSGENSSPLHAYKFNERKIATLADYVAFMPGVDGFDVEQVHLEGSYFTERFDENIRATLKAVYAKYKGYSVFSS